MSFVEAARLVRVEVGPWMIVLEGMMSGVVEAEVESGRGDTIVISPV